MGKQLLHGETVTSSSFMGTCGQTDVGILGECSGHDECVQWTQAHPCNLQSAPQRARPAPHHVIRLFSTAVARSGRHWLYSKNCARCASNSASVQASSGGRPSTQPPFDSFESFNIVLLYHSISLHKDARAVGGRLRRPRYNRGVWARACVWALQRRA